MTDEERLLDLEAALDLARDEVRAAQKAVQDLQVRVKVTETLVAMQVQVTDRIIALLQRIAGIQ